MSVLNFRRSMTNYFCKFHEMENADVMVSRWQFTRALPYSVMTMAAYGTEAGRQ